MMTTLYEMVTQVRQPFVELMLHVTFWAMLGILLYISSRWMMRSSRELLLCFCLGILALSLLILFPIKLWSPPASWQTQALTEQLSWQVSKQFETAVESTHSAEPAIALPATTTLSLNLNEWLSVSIGIVALLVVISLARLLLGLISLEWWRRSSEPIGDATLLDQFATLCQQMGITKSISLRVTSHLGSPATIGWWRPTILLPSSWTLWNNSERQAVLAHELAHVRNRDYPLWLAVQLAAALHTYHPLVRMLVKRLQGELELSADHLAAPFAGGTTNYMRTLCQLALRHGCRGAGHLSLALFPVQIPLSWRMMMLRSPMKTRRMPGIWSRLCLLGLLATLAVVISGFRGATVADEKKFDDEIVLVPSGSEKPADHPNSRVASMEMMILDMKKSELKKLEMIQQDGAYSATPIPENIDWVKKRLSGIAFKERVPACTISVWSEAPFGICITNKEKEGKVLFVTPCLTADGQTLELKSRVETIRKNPTAENGMEQTKIYEHASNMKLHQSACFVMPYDATDKQSDFVRVTFVSITSAKPLDGVIVKAENKQNYEIELRLVSVRKTVIEKFWKENGNNAEGKVVQHQPIRIYPAIQTDKFFEWIHSDSRSCTLCAPRLIVEEGQTACVTSSQDKNDSLSFSCNVKCSTDSNKFQLNLDQTMTGSVPQSWLGLDKTTHKMSFTAVLSEDQFCCISYPGEKKPSESEAMMVVTFAKVKKVQLTK